MNISKGNPLNDNNISQNLDFNIKSLWTIAPGEGLRILTSRLVVPGVKLLFMLRADHRRVTILSSHTQLPTQLAVNVSGKAANMTQVLGAMTSMAFLVPGINLLWTWLLHIDGHRGRSHIVICELLGSVLYQISLEYM